MVRILTPTERDETELDLCWNCRLLWFDPGELEALPKARPLSPAGEALGQALVGQLRQDRPDSRLADFLRQPASESVGTVGVLVAVYDLLRDLATGAFADDV